MPAEQFEIEMDYDLSTLTPLSLRVLYDKAIGGLNQCSKIAPGGALDTPAMEKREILLLEMEASVLSLASRVPLKSDEDINGLIDFWEKASGINDGGDIRPSDKIAMNIFRHLSSRLR